MLKYIIGKKTLNDFQINSRWLTSLHEASHAITAAVLNLPVVSAAVAADGYNGLVLFGVRKNHLYAALVHASGEPGANLNRIFERPDEVPFAAALLLEDEYPLDEESRAAIVKAGQSDEIEGGEDEAERDGCLEEWPAEVEGGSEASDEEKRAFVDKLAASVVCEWRDKIRDVAEALYFRGALCGKRLEAYLADVQPFGGPNTDLEGRVEELRYTPDGVFITGAAGLSAASGGVSRVMFAAAGVVVTLPAAAMAES